MDDIVQQIINDAYGKNIQVIHVSGSPGSGKSTLVEMLQKKHQIMDVFDTDEILEDDDPLVLHMRSLPQNTSQYVIAWKRAVRFNIEKRIQAAREKNVHYIIFCGILNNFSGPFGGIVDINDLAQHKYFLAPPLPVLLRRFYVRYETLKDDTEFWEGVARGDYPIPGSEDNKKMHAKEREWHVKNGYRIMSDQQSIIDEILYIIKYSS